MSKGLNPNHGTILFLLSLAFTLLPLPQKMLAKAAIIHAVLFYSPSCPHCLKVMTEDLPPMIEEYGDRLNIFRVNVTTTEGQDLFQSAVERFNIPDERLGVPCLIVGETVLVGSLEIPDKFPAIVEEGLASGGIPWPDIPGLSKMLSLEAQASAVPTQELILPTYPIVEPTQVVELEQNMTVEGETASEDSPLSGLYRKFSQDVLGNSIAVVVLLALLASAIFSSAQVIRLPEAEQRKWPVWMIWVFILAGLGIAIYLSFIEITQSEAVCGPVGDCNAVQRSPYARLFGVVPVGLIGVSGYILIAAAWLVHKYGAGQWRQFGALAAWALTLFGVLFFIYLTFLEPFVIGATCAWCLTSAAIMILMLWAFTSPAIEAWKTME